MDIIYLSRHQISETDLKAGSGYWTIDTSVKSARKDIKQAFAPTWELVMNIKKGIITPAEYDVKYRALLDARDYDENYSPSGEYRPAIGPIPIVLGMIHNAVESGKRPGRISFGCYCPDGKHCHTHVLIDWLCQRYGDNGYWGFEKE